VNFLARTVIVAGGLGGIDCLGRKIEKWRRKRKQYKLAVTSFRAGRDTPQSAQGTEPGCQGTGGKNHEVPFQGIRITTYFRVMLENSDAVGDAT
jgi:hypothetical protein